MDHGPKGARSYVFCFQSHVLKKKLSLESESFTAITFFLESASRFPSFLFLFPLPENLPMSRFRISTRTLFV